MNNENIKRTSEFRIEIGTNFKDDKRDITIIDKRKIKDKNGRKYKYYKYKCNKCGFDGGKHWNIKDKKYKNELWALESNFKKGHGCSCCGGNDIVVEDINSIITTAPWMIPIINNEEFCKTHTHSSHDKIYPTCSYCGRVKDKSMPINIIYKNKTINCICTDYISYPNKFMTEFLKQLHIEFEAEYNPKWCKYKFKDKIKTGRYDFYFKLNNKQYIIEMDGSFHNQYNNRNNQTAEESKFIDDEKDRLALEYNIEVIRIDCDYGNINDRFEYIKNNILQNDKLNKLFNFTNINWDKVEKFALSNLVKVACDYKRNNPEMTTTQIGEFMGGYNSSTVCNWLKQGNGIWCEYNPKEESRKSAFKQGKSNGKNVEIFKDNISLGVFASTQDLARKSEKIFGIKLSQTCISEVCLEKAKQHKGYTFKYV
ncbi:MAG: hypothetical protein Q8936_19465 [Bacillota bacterium]|nr:hypothetical protein [Bacillota bacterium]